MPTQNDLDAAIAKIQTDVGQVQTLVQDLKTQLANAQVPQEALDKLAAIDQALGAITNPAPVTPTP